MEPRPFCYACRHVEGLCVCADVVPIATRSRVIIVQHPDEAWNQIGTARLAHLGLEGSVLLEGHDFTSDGRLEAALDPRRETVLLFPSIDSRPLEDYAGRDVDIVLIDGTWPQARTLVKATPRLRQLPRVRLGPGPKSRYRIRMQPRAECVSTLEAAVRTLAVLEGRPERFEPLLTAFDRMVDRHIAKAAAAGRSIIRDLRQERASRPLPDDLAGPLERLVLVQGETLWVIPEGECDRKVELVHWTAHRLATSETLDLLLRPRRAFRDSEAHFLGVTRADLEAAEDPHELGLRWMEFAREDDVYLLWGYFAANAFGRLQGAPLAPLRCLRDTTKKILNRKVQRPENAALELDLPDAPPLARGRAGKRLAMLRELVNALRGDRGLSVAREWRAPVAF